MTDGLSTEKMNRRIDDYKYHVVKFLKNPFKDKARSSCNYICVPRSWAKWHRPENKIVEVWYPTQNLCNIEEKVRNGEKKSEQWESFFCTLEYSTHSYESAKEKSMDKNNKKDRTPIPATVDKKTSKTTTSVIENETIANCTQDAKHIKSLKRKTNDSDKSSHHKRSRENAPSESVDVVAGTSSQAIRSITQTLTHKNSNGYQIMNEAPVAKSYDRNTSSTEQKQIIAQNASKPNYFLDKKLIDKCCGLIKELEKRLGSSLVRTIINKLLNVDFDNDNNACGENDSGGNDCGENDPTDNDCGADDCGENDPTDNDCGADDCGENDPSDNDCSSDDCGENDPSDNDRGCSDDDFDVEDCDNEDFYEDAFDDNFVLIDPIIKEEVPPKYNVNESDDHNELFMIKSPQPIRKLDAINSKKNDLDSGVDNERREKENNYPLPIIKEVVSPKYNANNSVNRNNYKNDFLKTKSSKPIKKAPPKVATMMRKDDPDYAGDEIERRKKKKGPLERRATTSPQQKPFILPPEYDANDSRWTLKYKEPAEGLVELIKYSCVYVDASRLKDCQKNAKHCETLCLMLLNEVFTESALSTCTLTGKKSFSSNIVRPGLDAHAREVILDFIADQEEKVKWHTPDRSFLTTLMTKKLTSIRNKLLKKSTNEEDRTVQPYFVRTSSY